MAEDNKKKYVSPSKLSLFLDNLKSIFSPLGHKHTTTDISDYAVDSELSSTSTNPVQNKVLDAEFTAINEALDVYNAALDDKSDTNHNHDDKYDSLGSAEIALDSAKDYTDVKISRLIFIGTYEEYQVANANNEIPINTFVILTDDESSGGGSDGDDTTSSTTAKLGYAVLGQMVLG